MKSLHTFDERLGFFFGNDHFRHCVFETKLRFPVMKILVIWNGDKMALPLWRISMEVLEEPLL